VVWWPFCKIVGDSLRWFESNPATQVPSQNGLLCMTSAGFLYLLAAAAPATASCDHERLPYGFDAHPIEVHR
jgi:hypothetical protein